jgi:hypothetical protein
VDVEGGVVVADGEEEVEGCLERGGGVVGGAGRVSSRLHKMSHIPFRPNCNCCIYIDIR